MRLEITPSRVYADIGDPGHHMAASAQHMSIDEFTNHYRALIQSHFAIDSNDADHVATLLWRHLNITQLERTYTDATGRRPGHTEIKLLKRLVTEGWKDTQGRVRNGYSGAREWNAANNLRKAGIVSIMPTDGSYWRRTRMGYIKAYHAQGMFYLR